MSSLLAKQPHYSGEIWVDRFGRPVEGRAPDERDFVAFAPVRLPFGGTVPRFTYQQGISRQENQRRFVQRNVEEQMNRTMLEQAALLVAQDKDGRRLMAMAKKEGFSVVFDKRTTEARDAWGLMDYANKLIPLHPETTPAHLARTLKHELEHMEQISLGLDYNYGMTVKSVIMAGRASEAGARVSEATLAFRLAVPQPDDHARQFKTTTVIESFCAQYSVLGSALRNGLKEAQAGKWSTVAASVFQAFYQEKPTLASYDKDNLDWLSKHAPRHAAANLLAEDKWSHEAIAEKIVIDGKPYLPKASKDFDLGKEPYCTFILLPEMKPAFGRLLKKLHKAYGRDDKRIEAVYDAVQRKPDAGFWRLAAKKLSSWTGLGRRAKSVPALTLSERPADVLAVYRMPDPERLKDFGGRGVLRDAAMVGPIFAEKFKNAQVHADLGTQFQYALEATVGGNDYVVDALVRAGMRVPMRGLPEEYLVNMLRKLDALKKTPEESTRQMKTLFTPEQCTLFQHWIELGKNGVDPVTGLPAGKVPQTKQDYGWAKELGTFFPPAQMREAGIPTMASGMSLASWGKTVERAAEIEAVRRDRERPVIEVSRLNR